MVARGEPREVEDQPGRARAADEVPRDARRAGVHPRLGALLGDRRQHRREERGGLGRVHRPVPAEPGRGRHLGPQDRRQGRLVDLHHERARRGHPAPKVAHVPAHPLGQ